MKETSSNEKMNSSQTNDTAQRASAGPEGIAIAPPAYGIRFLDHQPRKNTSGPGLVIQPKLAVGAANDRYEREADRVAEQILRKIDPISSVSNSLAGRYVVQEKPVAQSQIGFGGGQVSSETESAIRQEKGRGSPLDKSFRPKMEQAFGADFGKVRVHTDQRADQLSRSIQAQAFTTGRDIFFKQGEYNPSSQRGRGLLTHELTHVVQQNGASSLQRKEDAPEITRSGGDTPWISRRIERINQTVGNASYKNDSLVYKSYLVEVEVDDQNETPVNMVRLERKVRAWLTKTKFSGDLMVMQTKGLTDTVYGGKNEVECGPITGKMFEFVRQDDAGTYGLWQKDGPPESEGTNYPVNRDNDHHLISVDDNPGIGGMGPFNDFGSLFGPPAEFHAQFKFKATDVVSNQSMEVQETVDISENEIKNLVSEEKKKAKKNNQRNNYW